MVDCRQSGLDPTPLYRPGQIPYYLESVAELAVELTQDDCVKSTDVLVSRIHECLAAASPPSVGPQRSPETPLPESEVEGPCLPNLSMSAVREIVHAALHRDERGERHSAFTCCSVTLAEEVRRDVCLQSCVALLFAWVSLCPYRRKTVYEC